MIVEQLLKLPAVIDVEFAGMKNSFSMRIFKDRYDKLRLCYASTVGKAWPDPFSDLGFTDKLIEYKGIDNDDMLLAAIDKIHSFIHRNKSSFTYIEGDIK